jgi:hypothetical protein
LERELRRVLTPAQWREHEAFIKRRDDFDAPGAFNARFY